MARSALFQLMTENDVEREIVQWMQIRKWRRRRNHVGVFTTSNGARVSIGVSGFPDWSFFRSVRHGVVELCHVETKVPGKKPGKAQLEQIALLNHLGEPAWWADGIERHASEYSKCF